MSVIDELHVGDIGTVIEVTVKDKTSGDVVPIDAATTMTLFFNKSDGTTIERTATHTTDGSDGKMFYTTISGDINMAGEWKYQAYVVLPGGAWRGDILEFYVLPNLPDPA